ncbi:MAG: hypothetical protein ACOCRK_11110, partial [bacterium]
MKLYGAKNISDKELLGDILKEIKSSKKLLYLTATANLKILRNNFDNEYPNVVLKSFQDFRDDIINNISKNVFRNVEQKYLLEKLIDQIFGSDQAKGETYKSIVNELFELYSFIYFNGINKISKNLINKILNEYSFIEADIFNVYNHFVLKLKQEKGDRLTYQEAVKKGIEQQVKNRQIDKLILDGFLFFHELQKFLIEVVVNNNIDIVFVGKYDQESEQSSFLVDNIQDIRNELGIKEKLEINATYNNSYTGTNTLIDLKYNYQTIPRDRNLKYNMYFMGEGAADLRIITPFISRGDEFKFVTKEISKILALSDNPEETKNKICIVLARDKERYEEKLDNYFKEYGYFKFHPEDIDRLKNKYKLENNIEDLKSLEYFSRRNFIEDNKINIPIRDKYKLFNELDRIKLNIEERPIASYPIGQFIFSIYDIINEDMSVDKFKLILNS